MHRSLFHAFRRPRIERGCGTVFLRIPTPRGSSKVIGRIVVLEKRHRWASELRRQFAAERVPVTACRSTGDAEAAVRQCPSTLVVDLGASPGPTLELLGRLVARSPRVPVILVAPPGASELEWPARELGVAAFVSDSITGEELSALCRRQWNS